MADQQPGENFPAAGMPDPTRVEDADSPTAATPENATAPVRFSGSAAVPPPTPKKPRWRRHDAGADAVAAEEPTRTAPDDWKTTTPVDPWAGMDTPWEPFPLIDEAAAALPPTTVEPPAAAPPPTRVETPAAPPPPAPAGPPMPPPPAPPAVRKAAKRTLRKEAKAAKREQQQAARPPVQPGPPVAPPPPPWARRPAAPPPGPRKRRRWGLRLGLFSLLSVLCCCGLPFGYFAFPAARQYPVSASLPSSIADLDLLEDGASRRAAERLADQLQVPGSDDVFAGVYGDGRGKRVTLFGVTGLRLTPGSDVTAQLDRVTEEFGLTDVQEFDSGEFGLHERCGVGRSNGTPVVVCAWADHGSLATALFTRRSLADSAELAARLRNEVLVRN